MKNKLILFTSGKYAGVYHIVYNTDTECTYMLDKCYQSFLKEHGLVEWENEINFMVLNEHVAIEQYIKHENLNKKLCLN